MARRHRRQLGGFTDTLKRVPKPVWYGLGALGLFLLFRKRDVVAGAAKEAVKQVVGIAKEQAFKLALPAAGQRYADDMLRVAAETGLSPFLIAAFMEQESGYGKGLTTGDERGTGDAGHGRGLMQIDDRSHSDFLAKRAANGTPLWQIPYENIKYGVKVLQDNLRYFSMTPKAGSKVTVGKYARSMGVPAGTYPDPRPISGDRLLFAAIAAYNTGPGNALQALAAGKPADQTTTKTRRKDGSAVSYAASVLARLTDITGKADKAALPA